jgi:hypothetical protein
VFCHAHSRSGQARRDHARRNAAFEAFSRARGRVALVMRVVRIVLISVILVLVSGMSSAFERRTCADRRRTSGNRGPEIRSRDHKREEPT